ncbi:phosphotransferase family protein [Streptomyces sp. NPDC057002]|uniref:phosphotransferase family protein n=1 Tax=Streptomyces sp. NPDC057002 TaxID=3345992 RepID=UPI00363FC98C
MERGGILCLLIHDSGEFWSFPEHRHQGPGEANSWIRDRFDTEVSTLDVLRIPPDSTTPSYLFVHETHSAGAALPPGARWAPVSELTDVRCASSRQRRLLGLWSAARHRREGATWLPWRRPGWFAMATAWAAGELRGLGIESIGPVEQDGFRAWSCQLRLPTTAGVVHLKAGPPPHAHEPALTRLLADWCPGAVPSVLAVDAGRRLMLTADFGPVRRPEGADRIVSHFERVARQAALIQRESAARTEEITATGCPAHRLDRLPCLFDDLITQDSAELTREESARLRRLVPGFARDCARLALLGLPDTLVHHDLWRGNFRVDGDDVLLFDWADTVLTHPFLQLDVLLADLADALGSTRAHGRVRDSYLEAWAGHRPPEELREGAALASAIAPVSRALLMGDRLSGAPSYIRTRYRGAVAAPLRACFAPGPRERGHTPEPVTRGT